MDSNVIFFLKIMFYFFIHYYFFFLTNAAFIELHLNAPCEQTLNRPQSLEESKLPVY